MKVNIIGKTESTISFDFLNHLILRGTQVAADLDVDIDQLGRLKGLESAGFIEIEYHEDLKKTTKTTETTEKKEDVEDEPKRRGRPKGSKNKKTLEKEIEDKAVIVTDEGVLEGKASKNVVGEAEQAKKANASIKAMKDLDTERAEFNKEDAIDESDLDPSEQMGGKAVIATGEDIKRIDIVNSIVPEADTVKERDPFIDREDSAEEKSDAFLNDDASGEDDSFIEL